MVWGFLRRRQRALGKPQLEKCRVYLGIAQMGGGVSTLAQMVWGTYAVKIEVQMAFAQVGPEIKCPRVPV